jgi:iron complex outermembrane receptor protein
VTGRPTNTLNNQGIRGQLLFTPSVNTNIILAADITTQRPDGYAQVIAGVAPTQRAAYRQFNAIIKDLNYQLPSQNAFDRRIDQDTPWRSGQDMGGVSLNIDTKIEEELLLQQLLGVSGIGIRQTIEILQDYKYWLNHKIQQDKRS